MTNGSENDNRIRFFDAAIIVIWGKLATSYKPQAASFDWCLFQAFSTNKIKKGPAN